jgi:hypothetical protein
LAYCRAVSVCTSRVPVECHTAERGACQERTAATLNRDSAVGRPSMGYRGCTYVYARSIARPAQPAPPSTRQPAPPPPGRLSRAPRASGAAAMVGAASSCVDAGGGTCKSDRPPCPAAWAQTAPDRSCTAEASAPCVDTPATLPCAVSRVPCHVTPQETTQGRRVFKAGQGDAPVHLAGGRDARHLRRRERRSRVVEPRVEIRLRHHGHPHRQLRVRRRRRWHCGHYGCARLHPRRRRNPPALGLRHPRRAASVHATTPARVGR